ncbi:MAG: GAF domain-containing protein [Dehalococcoidia bacterium]|nr:GAF domain-containing protein [Dehalococcoidia bacterium]
MSHPVTGPGVEVPLRDIPTCFEGIIPSSICSVGPDGMPNVTFLSVVHLVDDRHVALSRQFFKKTDENTARNPLAQVGMVEPATGRQFYLDLRYDHTETSGPLFERMRTRLDAVAAYEGMTNVFHLKGVDVCEVLHCEMAPCDFPEGEAPRVVGLEKVEAFSAKVAAAEDLDELLRVALEGCEELLGCRHAFVMLVDETGQQLYTVASTGYASSGTGSEVWVGEGLVGLAAERRQSIRVTNMARDLMYAHAARGASAEGRDGPVIPLPGLPAVQSQLVIPMLAHRKLAGVLALQSETAGAFQAADECLASITASQVAMAMASLGSPEPVVAPEADSEVHPVQVKYYADDESVFLDNEYLIRGIAGGVLWRLLRSYQEEQRVEFSNRELRLDSTLALPDIKDNLEARLILLRKRLEERCDYLRIEKTARGRFRLVVTRPLTLVAADGAAVL